MRFLQRFTGLTKALAVSILLIVGLFALVPRQAGAVTSLYNAIGFVKTGHLVFSDTAPTIASGFGTSPSIVASNGATVFEVNVGTGGTATNGVITMPAATTGWNCSVTDLTSAAGGVADAITAQTTGGTTSVTVKNRTVSTGVAVAWDASDKLRLVCGAY